MSLFWLGVATLGVTIIAFFKEHEAVGVFLFLIAVVFYIDETTHKKIKEAKK